MLGGERCSGGDGDPKKLSGISEDNYVNGVVVHLRAEKKKVKVCVDYVTVKRAVDKCLTFFYR